MGTGRHLVLTTFGSLGDLHPYLALALEMQARGHRATIATIESFRKLVEAEGVGFHPVRPDPADTYTGSELIEHAFDVRHGPEFLIRDLLIPHLAETYEDLAAICRTADALVSNTITLASPLVAEKQGLTWVSAAIAPTLFFSAYDPPVLAPAPGLANARVFGPRVNRALLQALKRSTYGWTKPWHRFREEIGLPPTALEPVYEGQFSPRLNLAIFSRLIGSPQPDWPPNTVQTGFLFYDRSMGAGLDPALDAFLDGGDPPIVFTLGSAAVQDAGDFYAVSVEAAKELGRRAVLLIGRDPRNRPTSALPGSMAAFEYAPYSALFPRAAAIVHQCGIGTTAQALRSGRPMLGVPFAFDQPDNAARAVKLGVARTIGRKEYKVGKVVSELRELLGEPSYARRASEIGSEIRAEDGLKAAADAIEGLWR